MTTDKHLCGVCGLLVTDWDDQHDYGQCLDGHSVQAACCPIILDEASDIPEMTEEDFARMEMKTPKDFIAPLIAQAYQAQAMQYLIGMDRGTLDYSATITGRFGHQWPKLPSSPEPDKRAKTKAARKQRRKQK